jgi:hypothetical protein
MSRRLVAVFDFGVVFLTWGLIGVMLSMLLGQDGYVAATTSERTQLYVRNIQFDFVGWTLNAIGAKLWQNSVDEQSFLSEADRAAVVRNYFKLRARLEQVEGQIANKYADPNVADPTAATVDLRVQQTELRAQMRSIQSLAEGILQEQLSVILAEQGLTTAGQPLPPVAFHLTDLPFAFIISPRDTIRQDANLDIRGDLSLDQQVVLEDTVSKSLHVSALVVPLGGIGTYPTMVGQSSDLPWIASVIAHEWTHNYLAFRPLGMNYEKSPALRTMNETTAEGIGSELGALLIQRYYPELAPPPARFGNILPRSTAPAITPQQAPSFDFVAEMHDTRVTVDSLLAKSKVDEAEAYMEARRRVMWDNGYQIRKLNQAYFAFYGAYASAGGGAAGSDPVGGAVRLLRRRSSSIAEFVNTMATFSSFEELQSYLDLPAAQLGRSPIAQQSRQ